MTALNHIRPLLGRWSSRLGHRRLTQALVVAGALEANPWLLQGTDLEAEVRAFFQGAVEPLDWKPPVEALSLMDARTAADVVEGLPSIRLRVLTGPGIQFGLYWWVQVLNDLSSVSAVVLAEAPDVEPVWQWPVRFGFLDDRRSAALRRRFERFRIWPALQKIVDAGEGCDILVLPTALSRADELDLSGVGASGLALVLGPVDIPPEEVPRAADRLALRLDSWGSHLSGHADEPIFLNGLTESLSHNDPIDLAFGQAARMSQSTAWYTTLTYSAFWSSRLETAVSRFADHLNSLGEYPVVVPEGMQGMLPGGPMPVGRVPAWAVGGFLREAIEQQGFAYLSESHEATAFALLVESVGELPEPPSLAMGNGHGAGPAGEEGVEVRIIQGAVEKEGSPHRLALQVGEEYTLRVWIGVESEESITVEGAPPFPVEELPKGPNLIDVVFTCLGNVEETQRSRVTLPEKGDSDPAELTLSFAEPGYAFGRLALLHGGRVIQTAVLRADVVETHPSRLGRPQIEVEAVMRSRIAGVGEEERFDLAVVVNRDTTGRKTTTAIRDDGVTIRSAQGLENDIVNLTDQLTAVADDPDAFSSMSSPQTLQWLLGLANLGYGLRRAFVTTHGIDPDYFAKGRVQVVSARADAYLPVEFFYGLNPPNLAELCKNWKKAVLSGECGSCEALGLQDPRPVCLSGFWGVRYVIERHAHRPEYGGLSGDWHYQREPTTGRNRLQPLESIVWGLSDNILDNDRRGMGRALSKKLFAATKASNWSDVQGKVGEIDPSMVFLLPHVDTINGVETSEIGGEADMVTLVEQRMCAPREKDFVTVLLGCDTAKTNIPYQGLVPGFRAAGAAVVVTTVNAILGRHAVPVAKELLKILKSGSITSDRSMGDALRDLRRRALADGYPMVLSVVAFGDADWVLSP